MASLATPGCSHAEVAECRLTPGENGVWIGGHAHRDFGARRSHTLSGSSPTETVPGGRTRAERSDTTSELTALGRRRLNALAIGPNVLAPIDAPAQPA